MGSGFKDWAAGDVLTAADVDGYLMRQTVMTFADASARDTALSGVLDEGMMAYLEDTDRLTFYTGAAWADVVESVAGLVPIKRVTITGTPATVAVTSVFSATYKNYRVVMNLTTTGTAAVNLQFGATTSNYYWGELAVNVAGTLSSSGASADSSITPMTVTATTGGQSVIEIADPFGTARTGVIANGNDFRTSGTTAPLRIVHGYLNDTTSYTDFTLSLSSNLFSAGTIDVYGYNNV